MRTLLDNRGFPFLDLIDLSHLMNSKKRYQYKLEDCLFIAHHCLLTITTGKVYISPVLSFYIDVYYFFLLFHYLYSFCPTHIQDRFNIFKRKNLKMHNDFHEIS